MIGLGKELKSDGFEALKGFWYSAFLQGRRKHLKLGGGARHFEGTFALRKKGNFLKRKRVLLCLLQNIGGTCPQ